MPLKLLLGLQNDQAMIPVSTKPSFSIAGLLPRLSTAVAFLLLAGNAMAEQRSGNIFGLPPCVTVSGEKIDSLFHLIFWLTATVFVLTQGTYIVYLIKYRRRPGVKAHYSHGNNTLEIIWTTAPTIFFLALAIYGNRIWDEIHSPAPDNALTIDVSAYQFGWQLRYPGITGKLSPSDVTQISMQNPFGTDAADPRTTQDVISPDLVMPVGRPIHVLLHSRDVIHSFYVPEFRLYQDCVPGRTIGWVWFEATRTGDFQLACSQLCGTGHYNMKAPIHVVSEADFEKWLSVRQQKNAGGSAAATSNSSANTSPASLTSLETKPNLK
jgi:cytochrome c oxidase subunit 2